MHGTLDDVVHFFGTSLGFDPEFDGNVVGHWAMARPTAGAGGASRGGRAAGPRGGQHQGRDDLRSLMSDDMIRVRLPYVADHMIRNVTRCLVLSNTEPDTLNGRLFPIRCGDGHIGDQAYFERLHDVIQSPNALRTFWSYLKRRGPWARVRHRLYLRSIVLYWLDLTKPLMEEGGAAFDHDMAEFEEWGSGVFG